MKLSSRVAILGSKKMKHAANQECVDGGATFDMGGGLKAARQAFVCALDWQVRRSELEVEGSDAT
jgi:hypothetical protein